MYASIIGATSKTEDSLKIKSSTRVVISIPTTKKVKILKIEDFL